uniref:Facilitated trehalose transporter Tret1 n=1 Tax=Sipha flava TaxID=143950 RepID=A0A2S2Q0I1_9HEMI
MILTNIPGVIGWILLYYAQSATILCVSIIIMGFNVGFNFGPTYSYIGEMTEPRLRGIMASLLSMAVMTGSLLTFALGSMLHWRTVALVNACCPIICICLIAAIPESPIWLMAKGKNDEAEKAICWLRGWVEPETVKHEFLELIRYNERSKTQVDADSEGGLLKKLAYFKDPSVYRPFKLLMIYFFVAFIVCIIPGRPYIGKILTEVGVPTNQGLYLIIFAALQGIGSVVLMVVVNRLGKRFLTLLTLSINSIMLLLFGVYTLVLKNNFVSSTPWIPLTILCIIYFSGSCGVLSIPYLLTSEVFPNNCRGIATGVCGGLSNIIIFIITAMYLFVENVLTLEYTMILYGLVGIFGLIYFYLYLPETENQTLLEIEEHFT